jgi:citronellol/citronellal dehydrogenase
MRDLRGKVLFITGASRGIGKAVALRAARDGAKIVIASKTGRPHPRLPGTIFEAAGEIEAAGGEALAVETDIRVEDQVYAAIDQAVARFGGIDILVNNASAISLTQTRDTPLRRFDLMMEVNIRGTFVCSQACVPWLSKSSNPHILVIAPPPDLARRWFAPHPAYTVSKYGMSLLALGMAEEFRDEGIAVNALWPRTLIATAALTAIDMPREVARKPEIVADAAHEILCSDARRTTGNFFIDEQVLRAAGCNDFARYAVTPTLEPKLDLFVSE